MALLMKERNDILDITFLSGISSVVAAIMSLVFCHIIKHKVIIALGSILGGITVTVVYVIGPTENNKDMCLLLYLVAYTFHTSAFFTVWNLTPRIFPTETRGEATGVVTAIGELSFVSAKLILPIVISKSTIYLTTLWCSIAVVVLCCFILFSVHKRELPDILEDVLDFRHTCKPIRWSTLRATSSTLEETEVKMIDFERAPSLSSDDPNIKRSFRIRDRVK